MSTRSPSISVHAGLSTSACQAAVFVGFRLSHQASTRQKHPKHNIADRVWNLYLVTIATRITTYTIVSGILTLGSRISIYSAAIAHKDSTARTNHTETRTNP